MSKRKAHPIVPTFDTHIPRNGPVRKVNFLDWKHPPSQDLILRCQFIQHVAWIGRRRARQLLISRQTPVDEYEARVLEVSTLLGEEMTDELLAVFAECTFYYAGPEDIARISSELIGVSMGRTTRKKATAEKKET